MDQRQIERFIDVVESGSLSRTSQRLNITQPALSKSLRLLEDQLGTSLGIEVPDGPSPFRPWTQEEINEWKANGEAAYLPWREVGLTPDKP